METLAGLIDPGCRGSPRCIWAAGGPRPWLRPDDMIALDTALRSRFRFDSNAEISVEMDPNDLTADKYVRASLPCGM